MATKSPEILSESSATLNDDLSIGSAEVCKDDEFYFNFVTFKVENYLFRVPRHEFEQQSTVFHDMFGSPPVGGKENMEGESDNNPILLDSVSRDAFKLLLKLLYPPRSKDISSSLTLEQCTSLLKVTHMWDFERINLIVKDRIREVLWFTIPCVDKIKLAHDYEIKDWYADAYCELATRTKPLSVEDGWKLGLEFSIKMGQVRERVVADASKSSGVRKDLVARSTIDKIFFATQHTKNQTSISENMREDDKPEEKDEEAAEVPERVTEGTSIWGWEGNENSFSNINGQGFGRGYNKATKINSWF
ncbi:hypothetical protein ACEPAH_6679 [Sanghuangporus vaninii]